MVNVSYNSINIQSNLIGLYNATNINAAIALGKYFNIDDNAIKNAIQNYTPSNNRSQLIKQNNSTIILDAYNANPTSMEAALINFFQLEGTSKVAILGDMFELGDDSKKEHKKIVELCSKQQNIIFYFVGSHFNNVKTKAKNLSFYTSTQTFYDTYKTLQLKGSLILIKGSRGMQLETLLK